MSEFVECQNCGRRFFAENLDCPYCRDHQDLHDLMDTVQRSNPAPSAMFSGMLAVFRVLLLLLILLALAGMVRNPDPRPRAFLTCEAVGAAILWLGVRGRYRWARLYAIVFVATNALLGGMSFFTRTAHPLLYWGWSPLALVIFLVPFASRQAGDHFTR